MAVNYLHLCKSHLHLYGFPLIENIATFCIYPGGVVIVPKERPREEDYYIEVAVDADRNIYSDTLLCRLKNCGVAEKEQFVQINGVYVECYPRSEKML